MKKRSKHTIREEDFTLKLAIQDTLPVLFFFGTMVLLATFFPSKLFILGASCSLIAGMSKIVWKFLMALKRGNKKWLSDLFIPFQCIGFFLMIASLVVDRKLIRVEAIIKAVTSFPSAFFFLAGVAGMGAMIAMSIYFDQSVKSHWRAQLINTVAQGCFFIGMVLVR